MQPTGNEENEKKNSVGDRLKRRLKYGIAFINSAVELIIWNEFECFYFFICIQVAEVVLVL